MTDARAERGGVSGDLPDQVTGGTPDAPQPVTPALLRRWPLPQPGGSKYSRGQVLVIGGDRATPGAAMLAAVAALRMGAGRLSMAVAASVAAPVAVAVPESGVVGLPDDDAGAITGEGAAALLEKDLERADAVLLGPGLGSPEGALRLLTEVAGALPADAPVVLDAFGATALPDLPARHRDSLAGRLVLTPNKGELERMLGGDEVPDDETDTATLRLAERFGAAVGCDDWVAHDGALWRTTTGDTGLGTSGSGDVMAGAVAGLLSRGAGLPQALVWGKHVHAAAGDALAARVGRVGYLASEIPPELPLIMRILGGD